MLASDRLVLSAKFLPSFSYIFLRGEGGEKQRGRQGQDGLDRTKETRYTRINKDTGKKLQH